MSFDVQSFDSLGAVFKVEKISIASLLLLIISEKYSSPILHFQGL